MKRISKLLHRIDDFLQRHQRQVNNILLVLGIVAFAMVMWLPAIIEANIKADHERIQEQNDRLWACIINLFTDGQMPSRDQAAECRRRSTEDTTPALRETSHSSMNMSSSSSNSTPKKNSNPSDNSQNNKKPEPKSMLRFVPGVDKPLIGCAKGRCL